MLNRAILLTATIAFAGCGRTPDPILPASSAPATVGAAEALPREPLLELGPAEQPVLSPAQAMQAVDETRVVEFTVFGGSLVFHRAPNETGNVVKQSWAYLSDQATEQPASQDGGIVVGVPQERLNDYDVASVDELVKLFKNKRVRATGKIQRVDGIADDGKTPTNRHLYIEMSGAEKLQVVETAQADGQQ